MHGKLFFVRSFSLFSKKQQQKNTFFCKLVRYLLLGNSYSYTYVSSRTLRSFVAKLAREYVIYTHPSHEGSFWKLSMAKIFFFFLKNIFIRKRLLRLRSWCTRAFNCNTNIIESSASEIFSYAAVHDLPSLIICSSLFSHPLSLSFFFFLEVIA